LQAVEDFRAALALDPNNAELAKLLQTAKDKYLEVEGVSIDDAPAATSAARRTAHGAPSEKSVEHSLAIEQVNSVEDLLLPAGPAKSWELLQQGRVSIASSGSSGTAGFVRVSVVSDEDSDSEDDEDDRAGGAEEGAGGRAGFSRVAVVEESDSDEDEEEGKGAEEQQQSAEELKDQGNTLMGQKRTEEAVRAYTDSLRVDPQYTPALNNRAQAHLALGNYAAAIADCDAVLRLEAGNVKALYRRASARAALMVQEPGQRSLALQDLSAVLAAEPGHTQAKQLYAQVSSAPAQVSSAPVTTGSGSQPSAQASTPTPAAVSASSTLDVQKLKQKAQQLLGDGLNDKVVALLGQYLRAVDEPPFSELLQSDRTTLLHLLATAYAATADYEHAVAVQEAILHIDPTNFRALYKRAEAQLQIAMKAAAGAARTAALELAEKDIAAAMVGQGANNTDVLALRQKLLRLRNTDPPAPAAAPVHAVAGEVAAPAPAASATSSSRQQSDMQKELGNTAMAEKHYTNALHHYGVAIQLDDTNLAAFNNRALAHMKLGDHAAAEKDATAVIDGAGSADRDTTEALHTLKLKALCRRAQARRALGDAKVAPAGRPDWRTAEPFFRSAVADLNELLKLDPTNKTGQAEMKQAKEAVRRCEEALAPMPSVGAAASLPKPPQPAAAAKSTPAKATTAPPASSSTPPPAPPRADMQRVSSLLAPSKAAASPSAFGDLGMVARSSKKLNTSSGASAEPASPAPAAATSSSLAPAAASPSPGAGKATAAVRGSPATSAASVVLTSAPTEPPKTVYE
jgi:tetratricopeptide (TPR) repeat protein